jgi:phosphoserine aminotransferase
VSRAHNFSAGPAAIPESVIQEIIQALPEFKGTGMGLMEISHRSKQFDETLSSAEARMRSVLGIPADYKVLFLQGGASLQFYMTALNLLRPGEPADFVLTGVWSNKAIKEAKRVGDAQPAWDGKETGYTRLPADSELRIRKEAVYVHTTSNNTIYGTQWHREPDLQGHHVVCDMSSDICCRPIDVKRYDVIYAGAQKNLGPSGITAVVLSPWAMERCPGNTLPAMLDYRLQAEERSLYNTTNTFAIFALERVLAWIEGQGGLDGMQSRNSKKAETLYAELDRTEFWIPRAQKADRSWMNVTWRTHTDELDKAFVSESDKAGLKGLKGHRSAAGLRASLYNAVSLADVTELVAFMQDFERRHG